MRDAAPNLAFARLDGSSAPQLGGALLPETAAAPAEPCAAAATTHPWPEACAASLSDVVGTAVVAPGDDGELRRLAFALVAAPEGDRALRTPPALRWSGRTPAAQRQAAGLWLVAGGPILLGDNLANLQAFSAEDLVPLRAALALGAGGGEPLEPGDAAPPTRFAGPGYALAVNWSDAPLAWQPGPDLAVAQALAAGRTAAEVGGTAPATARDVFGGAAEPAPVPRSRMVPARDAVLLALPR
jgi:hypothetical protein